MHAPKKFRYGFDPVPLACTAAYLVYRVWLKHTAIGHIPFFHDHFNDVLCLPIFLPSVLWVNREIGLRDHDRPPTPFELLLHLAIWSVYFEGVAPLLTNIYRTTADPLDAAAYAVGGLTASLIWGTWRQPTPAYAHKYHQRESMRAGHLADTMLGGIRTHARKVNDVAHANVDSHAR